MVFLANCPNHDNKMTKISIQLTELSREYVWHVFLTYRYIHRCKLPQRSGGGAHLVNTARAYDGIWGRAPCSFQRWSPWSEVWGAKPPPKPKTFCLSEVQMRCKFVHFYKLLKYTFWKNIVAFLFEVILLVVTLWQKVGSAQKPESHVL